MLNSVGHQLTEQQLTNINVEFAIHQSAQKLAEQQPGNAGRSPVTRQPARVLARFCGGSFKCFGHVKAPFDKTVGVSQSGLRMGP
ncbi:hypothetical protein GCM10009760_43740 [Kitasatospora kazusensis]|uniref:Uncharacterized protein n=1 Tax=Kitasatospora kazusensis TaxID=407974 RepID=A0ABP5LMH8_9ACTN